MGDATAVVGFSSFPTKKFPHMRMRRLRERQLIEILFNCKYIFKYDLLIS